MRISKNRRKGRRIGEAGRTSSRWQRLSKILKPKPNLLLRQ